MTSPRSDPSSTSRQNTTADGPPTIEQGPDGPVPYRPPAAPAADLSPPAGGNGMPPVEARVQAIARVVDRALRRVEDLDGRVSALAEVITDLAHKLSADRGGPDLTDDDDGPAAASGEPQPPGVRSWLLADDPAQADADLADLTLWVWRIYLWWPDAWLSSCWLWHPEVIEELWWLRVAHADALHPKTGTAWRVADWHDRLRPGVVRRLRPILVKCELNRHIPVNGRPIEVTPPGPPGLARHAAAVAAVWAAGAGLNGAVRATGPRPTAEQLAEAEAYQNAAYRHRR